MEKLFSILKLGIKYLYRYRKRYYFLSAALVLGFTVVIFVTSTKDGMYNSVYYSAQSHYAGDIVVMGYETPKEVEFLHRLTQHEIEKIITAAEKENISPRHTILRTYYGNDAVVFHQGNAVTIKNTVGCDWETEAPLFSNMNFQELPDNDLDDNSIILSHNVANFINAKKGDSVVLEIKTRYGQKNTGHYIVRGIVRDNSIFGYYKVYVSRLSLNRLMLYGDNDCSSVGFFLKDTAKAENARLLLQNNLSEQNLQLGEIVHNRDEFESTRKGQWDGIKIFLYTLPVYLSEISQLLDVMNIITYIIYIMMLLTILASASVTYRLIIHERAKEIGIMRSIGFLGKDLCFVLWTEIIVLGIISMIAGFILSLIISYGVSFLSFSWFPGFDIFLRNERLVPLFLPGTMLTNIGLLIIILLTIAVSPSYRVTNKKLTGLLSGGSI